MTLRVLKFSNIMAQSITQHMHFRGSRPTWYVKIHVSHKYFIESLSHEFGRPVFSLEKEFFGRDGAGRGDRRVCVGKHEAYGKCRYTCSKWQPVNSW